MTSVSGITYLNMLQQRFFLKFKMNWRILFKSNMMAPIHWHSCARDWLDTLNPISELRVVIYWFRQFSSLQFIKDSVMCLSYYLTYQNREIGLKEFLVQLLKIQWLTYMKNLFNTHQWHTSAGFVSVLYDSSAQIKHLQELF